MIKNLEPELKVLSEFLLVFNEESDRGAALTAASLLDERLKEILQAFFADVSASNELLSGFNAPLGTFSSRSKATFSLGLIQENEYHEINIIRKIRNRFGHSWKDMSFETQEISNLCNELPWLGPDEFEEGASSRSRFNWVYSDSWGRRLKARARSHRFCGQVFTEKRFVKVKKCQSVKYLENLRGLYPTNPSRPI